MGTGQSIPLRRWWRLSELEEYEALSRARLRHVVEVREPLVLISQVQRSGGTLLSQLFDGHVEVHAHPQQLHIGYPSSRDWPPLTLGDPERCFALLYEKKTGLQLRKGYRKSRRTDRDMFPFCFLPRLQNAIFQQCFASWTIERERDVLDCYFTSYFNAWLDNHNLYTGPKKVVTGFAPRLGESAGNVDRLFEIYPDGFLVSLVRDPRSWYASVSVGPLARKWPDVPTGLKAWRRSVEAAIDARERFPERVSVLTYEQLVGDTESSMGWLAGRIGLTMSPVLLMPTFNGRPIRANSSYAVERHGVLPERVTAYREKLDAETIAQIEESAGDLYERAASLSAAD